MSLFGYLQCVTKILAFQHANVSAKGIIDTVYMEPVQRPHRDAKTDRLKSLKNISAFQADYAVTSNLIEVYFIFGVYLDQ